MNAAAFETRALLIAARTLYGEAFRLEHEAIFEHGHVTRDSLDRYVSRIASARKVLQLSDNKMLRIAAATEQFWANYQYLRDLPIDNARGWTEQQRFHAIMAKAGEYQVTLDRELGLQASTVNGMDARRPLGQAYRGATLATYLLNNAVTLAWLTSGGMDLSTAAGRMDAASRLLFGLGNAALMGHGTASLSAGVHGVTWDGSPTMKFIQAGGLTAIAGAGIPWTLTDAMRAYSEFAAGDPLAGGSATAAALLNAAFSYYSAQAAGIGWNSVRGGSMPTAAQSARVMALIAGALALREIVAFVEMNSKEKEDGKDKAVAQSAR